MYPTDDSIFAENSTRVHNHLRIALKRSGLYLVKPDDYPDNMTVQCLHYPEPYQSTTFHGIYRYGVLVMIADEYLAQRVCRELYQNGHRGYNDQYWQSHDWIRYYMTQRQWAFVQNCLNTGSLKRLSFFLWRKWLWQKLRQWVGKTI